ncbi:RNA polymerase sigma factor [Spirillospora sp. CA-128828]|uniref:RNA polymerase sigma factor n=1 Tax=Spirillospora sp. CA-128828 TaxID=3240033 RepID=UPI003D93BFE3
MTGAIPPEHADEVGKLYVQTAQALFGYACTLPQVDPARAEDLVQVAFQEAAVCWDKLAALDAERRRQWLFRVVRNKAIDEWRRNRRVQPDADPAEHGHPAAEPFSQVLSTLALRKCWSAIERMPTTRQRVAFLRWNEEWSTREIADWLGVASATVRWHLKIARDELVEQVGSAVPFLDGPEDACDSENDLGEEAS